MIFKFEPHYFERVWGGRALERVLGREIPPKIRIGESWEIVDRTDCQSILSCSQNNSISLRNLLESQALKIMGPGWNQDRRFPLLVKWLDCTDRLSLQVHPPSKMAKSLKGEPKTENWYIVHAEDNAGLFVGLKKGTSKEAFLQALEQERLETVCYRTKSNAGDSILVESGRMHAIDAGNLILEIQQNSDTTYRVYDWGRKGTDGLPRQLHIDESIQCIDFDDFEPNLLSETLSSTQTLADCDFFRIRKFKGIKNQTLALKETNDQCIILNPIDARVSIGGSVIESGKLGLSPFNQKCEVTFLSAGDLIVTDNFYRPGSIA
ncbi:MAG: type I phosphomannose isomerase catalytic subunit [Opitutae bacterium]